MLELESRVAALEQVQNSRERSYLLRLIFDGHREPRPTFLCRQPPVRGHAQGRVFAVVDPRPTSGNEARWSVADDLLNRLRPRSRTCLHLDIERAAALIVRGDLGDAPYVLSGMTSEPDRVPRVIEKVEHVVYRAWNENA
jgi:hypothetical protein